MATSAVTAAYTANARCPRRVSLSLWSRLFPHFAGLQVERVLVTAEAVHVQVRRTTRTASCSGCGRRSRRVHSYYTRQIADEPLGGRSVEIHLRIRRFRCD